jgi:hypothetical protein
MCCRSTLGVLLMRFTNFLNKNKYLVPLKALQCRGKTVNWLQKQRRTGDLKGVQRVWD